MKSPAPLWRPGDPIGLLRDLIERGGVLAVPTESSYGLAADPRSERGVAAIYRVKEREAGKPLPVVAAGLEQLAGLGLDMSYPLLQELAPLWPAALSVVVPLLPGRPPLPAAADGETLAVRVPDHTPLLRLLAGVGTALTATSANPSGDEPVLDPQAAAELLAGEDAVVVDSGRLAGGPPSTLVAEGPEGPAILRSGRVPAEQILRRCSSRRRPPASGR